MPAIITMSVAAKRLQNTVSGLVVFDGDSITVGVGTSGGAATYPAQTISSLDGSWTSINFGQNGQTVAEINAAGLSEDSDYNKPHNFCVLFGGTNDLFFGASAATLQTRLQTWATNRAAIRTAGVKLVVSTILPRVGGSFVDADRQTVNTWLRANWSSWADALCDWAAIGIDDEGDEATFSADNVHPNDTYAALMGGNMAAVITSLL